MYTGEFWDDLEEQQEEYERQMAKFEENKQACHTRMESYKVAIAENEAEVAQAIQEGYNTKLADYNEQLVAHRQDYDTAKAEWDEKRDAYMENYNT